MSLTGAQNAPSLPRVIVNSDLPAGWDGVADATPVDSAALVTALAAVVQNAGIHIIELDKDTTYTGNFVIDDNAGTDWLIIRSSGWEVASPPVAIGTRVAPADNTNMATITVASAGQMRLDYSAHNVRFIGIEFTLSHSTAICNLVGFASGSIAPIVAADLCNDITYDRCFITSTSEANPFRTGIQVACNRFAAIDCYIDNCKDTSDAQAILTREGVGHKIHNCYLEATGENLMTGGNDNGPTGSLAEDVTISKCHFFKPTKWDSRHADYNAVNWAVKNLLEFKMVKRVHVDSCVFEGNWNDAQSGSAFLVTVRNQSGSNPWAAVQDVTMENCKWSSIGRFFAGLSDSDNANSTLQVMRFRMRNCLIHTCGGGVSDTRDFGTQGRVFVWNNGTRNRPLLDVFIDHCTFVFQEGHLGSSITSDGGAGGEHLRNFTFINSLWDDGEFADMPDNFGNSYVNQTVSGNGIFFNDSANDIANRRADFATDYPGNIKADTIADVLFTDNANQDYTLQDSSPFKFAADDGKDCGVDFYELNAAIAGVE